MPDPLFDIVDWSRALTLRERAALLRGGASGEAAGGDPERARYQIDSWRKQAPFDRGDWLRRRLLQDHLEDLSFARLAGIPPETLPSGASPPLWVSAIREAYSEAEWAPASTLPVSDSFGSDPMSGFFNLVAPLARRALGRLRAGILEIAKEGGAPFLPDDPEHLFFSPIPSRVLWMLDRTLVLELNVARVEERLAGSTPEERFAFFVESLRRRETALPILREYAVLSRQVAEWLDGWVEVSLELIRRLQQDWPAISSAFHAGGTPGRLAEIQSGAGDTHRGGRSVAILRFESGEKLVYKPRSLAVDVHFRELLEWLNHRGDHPPFRLLKTLDRGSHGWIEFVSAEPCASQEDVGRYHLRLGGLLALLYAIGAVDFHFENLIASGDQPVPVDLESLFHPRVPRPESESPDERLAGRVLGESVLRVGLLPFRVGEHEGFAGSDLSGVASVAGMPSPDRMLHWERSGSDEMTAARKRMTLGAGKNRPTLDRKEADVADHIHDVVEGFHSVYRLLTAHRTELLSPGGPLVPFAADPIRAVLRSTRAYGLLLEESFHPDFLRDALDRDRFFDRLWVGVEEFPAIERIAGAEHGDLWQGDVPLFDARPDAVDLGTSTGEVIGSFFPERSLEEVRRRISRMGEEDLFRQSWLTRISLGTLLLNRSKGDWPGFPLSDPGETREEEIRSRLTAAARSIGDWFDRMAVRDEGHLTWVGLDLRNQIWSLYPMPEDLYSGAPGISLFLGYLALLTGEERFAEMARCGMKTLSAMLRRTGERISNIGVFQGWGGTVYSLAHLGALWRDRELLAEAEGMAEEIARRVEKDTYLDVVAGSAGAISALLALHRASGSPRALEIAVRCGERLLETARPAGSGLCWLTEIGGDEPLTGFSHGACGIAATLLDLFAVTGEERLKSAARNALDFERAIVSRETGLSPDRPHAGAAPENPAAEKVMAMSWCYGAPGRGFASLRAMRHLDEPALREDLERSVALTLERGFGKNHSLCHGDLGNLDLVLQVHRELHDEKAGASARRLTRAVLSSVERDGWICGTVANIEAPGLMNGIAGIGYGLLRLADPERVPSVLVMDPPPRSGTA
jgi:class II lanthipeptide synthase